MFAAISKSHVDKSGRPERRAGLVEQRIGPDLPVAESLRSSAQGAIQGRAGILITRGRHARDYQLCLPLPCAARIAGDGDADAVSLKIDALSCKETALNVRQMAMPLADLLHG